MVTFFGGSKSQINEAKDKNGGATARKETKVGEALATQGNEEKEDPTVEKKVGKFTKGDHMVHIFLQAGRKFQDPCGDETTMAIQIEIQIGSQKQYFECKNDVIVDSDKPIFWNEHIFFTLKDLSPSDAADTDIIIRALNKGFFRNELIGEYQMKMSSIYFHHDHKTEHVWIGLSNPMSDDFTKVQGVLKISGSVQGPNDEQLKLEPQVGPDNAQRIMMNAQLKRTFKQLQLSIIEAHDLPLFIDRAEQLKNFQWTADETVEPLFRCGFGGGKELVTEVVKGQKGINKIDQTFMIPIAIPTIQDRILMTVKDWNNIKENMIGSVVFSLADLLAQQEQNKGGFFLWRDIHGACQKYNDQDDALFMNLHPEVGNAWKGRILFHINLTDTEKPQKCVIVMDPSIRVTVENQKQFQQEQFQLMMDIGQGVGMPDDAKYQIQVQIRNEVIKSAVAKLTKGNYCFWNERLEHSWSMLPIGDSDKDSRMPTIFIFLVKGDVEIAFKKLPLSDFMNPNAQWTWIQFEKCTLCGVIDEDYQAGMINIKLSVVKKPKSVSERMLNQYPAWSINPVNKIKRMVGKNLKCYIFQCKGLPAADEDGSSDPFIRIQSHDGKDVETVVVDDTVDPIFMSCKTVNFDIRNNKDILDSPPVILNIFDSDIGYIRNTVDYMARSVIFLKDASFNEDPNVIPVPKWHDVKFGVHDSDPTCGAVLVSFSLFDVDAKNDIPDNQVQLAKIVEKKEYKISINILGLRNLKSSGLLPIQRAQILMKLKSMLPPTVLGVEDRKLQGEESGPNPNFCKTIDFKMDLPVDKLYCPTLSCSVNDQVFLGFSQPLIGTFSIPIGEIMHEQRQEREAFRQRSKAIIENLQSIRDKGTDPEKVQPINVEMIDISIQQSDKFNTVKNQLERRPTVKIEETTSLGVSTMRQPSLMLNSKSAAGPQEQQAREEKDEDQMTPEESKIEEASNLSQEIKKDPLIILGEDIIDFDPKWTEKQKMKAQKHNFLIEKKKKDLARKEKEKFDKEILKQQKWSMDDNLLYPHYEEDKLLNCFREIPNAFPEFFKEIGFNDQETIRQIMVQWNKKKSATDATERANCNAAIIAMTNKHLRRLWKDELENNKEIFPEMPFATYDITAGQVRGNQKGGFLSLFQKQNVTEDGQVSTQKKVGTIKCEIDVYQGEEDKEFNEYNTTFLNEVTTIIEQIYQKNASEKQKLKKANLNFSLSDLENAKGRLRMNDIFRECKCNFPGFLQFLQDIYNNKKREEEESKKTETVIHLYLISGYDLASRDIGSPSDPYFKLKCGTFEYDNRNQYQLDNSNPTWGEHIQFPQVFPGSKPLEIQILDYDDLFGDDLIGTTIIDLDDRFFTPNFRALEEAPMEQRQLYHPSTTLSQGVIEMWVDITDVQKADSAAGKVWNVKPEPVREYELRVSIFGCKGVPEADVEGTTDAYIRAFIKDKDVQETDTHYRCTTGNPNFNYRLLFNIKSPFDQQQVLSLQCWDRDLLKSNDLICEWFIDLTSIIKDSILTDKLMCLKKEYYEKSLKSRMHNEGEKEPLKFVKSPEVGTETYVIELETFALEDKEKKNPVTIQLDVRVIPKTQAVSNPVGKARDNPNIDPQLPEPKGRFQLSLNPFKMLNQLCGPKVRCKIWCIACSIFCIVLGIYFFPFIASVIQIITNLALSVTGLLKKI